MTSESATYQITAICKSVRNRRISEEMIAHVKGENGSLVVENTDGPHGVKTVELSSVIFGGMETAGMSKAIGMLAKPRSTLKSLQ